MPKRVPRTSVHNWANMPQMQLGKTMTPFSIESSVSKKDGGSSWCFFLKWGWIQLQTMKGFISLLCEGEVNIFLATERPRTTLSVTFTGSDLTCPCNVRSLPYAVASHKVSQPISHDSRLISGLPPLPLCVWRHSSRSHDLVTTCSYFSLHGNSLFLLCRSPLWVSESLFWFWINFLPRVYKFAFVLS